MLDLSGMKDAQVDRDARLAVAGPGLTLGEFDRATHEFGLADWRCFGYRSCWSHFGRRPWVAQWSVWAGL